jgi:hypothetical protein
MALLAGRTTFRPPEAERFCPSAHEGKAHLLCKQRRRGRVGAGEGAGLAAGGPRAAAVFGVLARLGADHESFGVLCFARRGGLRVGSSL